MFGNRDRIGGRDLRIKRVGKETEYDQDLYAIEYDQDACAKTQKQT